MSNKNTFFILALFTCINVLGQKKYTNEYSFVEKIIDEQTVIGYVTSFDFDRNTVRKAWWRHSKNFGHPKNMRKYYLTNIKNDLTIFTQAIDDNSNTLFFLGIKKEQEDLKAKTLELIITFKKEFYLSHFLSKFSDNYLLINNVSKKYEKATTENQKYDALTELDDIQKELENQIKKLKQLCIE